MDHQFRVPKFFDEQPLDKLLQAVNQFAAGKHIVRFHLSPIRGATTMNWTATVIYASNETSNNRALHIVQKNNEREMTEQVEMFCSAEKMVDVTIFTYHTGTSGQLMNAKRYVAFIDYIKQ
jgi:hypothetical protein